MAIATLNDYIGSLKQVIAHSRTTTRTSVANGWFTIHDIAGNPGAGTLAVGNTTAGVVPTDATNGFPPIGFSSGLGYIATVDFSNTVASRITLYDRLYHIGAVATTSTTTTTSPPSYSGRIPGGTDYTGTQLWLEQVTLGTGTQNINVTYLNQAAGTSTTGVVAVGSGLTVGRMVQIPLAAGDSGISQINIIAATTATGGTFNLVVTRPLWTGRVIVANAGDSHGLDRTGLPQIWTTSALALMVAADSSSTGSPDLTIEIASN
jgi:hypothetical protein